MKKENGCRDSSMVGGTGGEREWQGERESTWEETGIERKRENFKTSARITWFCYSFMICFKEYVCMFIMKINMTTELFSNVHVDSFCLNWINPFLFCSEKQQKDLAKGTFGVKLFSFLSDSSTTVWFGSHCFTSLCFLSLSWTWE